jgi:hypothetical protein
LFQLVIDPDDVILLLAGKPKRNPKKKWCSIDNEMLMVYRMDISNVLERYRK